LERKPARNLKDGLGELDIVRMKPDWKTSRQAVCKEDSRQEYLKILGEDWQANARS
jgi:hypothetical protein